jgi:hypothetical protein
MAKIHVYNFSTGCCVEEIISNFFMICYRKSKYVVLLVAHYFFIEIEWLKVWNKKIN